MFRYWGSEIGRCGEGFLEGTAGSLWGSDRWGPERSDTERKGQKSQRNPSLMPIPLLFCSGGNRLLHKELVRVTALLKELIFPFLRVIANCGELARLG